VFAVTPVIAKSRVPEVVIGPPVKAAVVATLVTVPLAPLPAAAHLMPSTQALSAVRTSPSAPTGRATGIPVAVEVTMPPGPMRQVLGIAAAAASKATLTAEGVAASESEVLVVELES
jgi:hypothetical protein